MDFIQCNISNKVKPCLYIILRKTVTITQNIYPFIYLKGRGAEKDDE